MKLKYQSLFMKVKNQLGIALLFFLISALSSCEIIGGIFKGGIYVGVILVILVIAVVVWLLSKIGRN